MVRHSSNYTYNGSPTVDDLRTFRAFVHSKPENEALYRNMGYFLAWYGAVETSLTMALYWAVNNHPHGAKFDRHMFDLLTFGMDAATKVTRLKQAITRRKMTLDDGMKRRLTHYQEAIYKIRNMIVHMWPMWLHKNDTLVAIRAIDFIRSDVFLDDDYDLETETLKITSFSISGDALFEHAMWLNLFAYDLGEAGPLAPKNRKYGTVRYRSAVPGGPGILAPQPIAPTTLHKHAQRQAEAAEALAEKDGGSHGPPKKSAKQRRSEAIARAKKAE